MPTLGQITESLGLAEPGNPGLDISGVAPLATAGPDHLTFLANSKYKDDLRSTNAAAVLVNDNDAHLVPNGTVALVCPDPYAALATVLEFFEADDDFWTGIHSTAVIHPDADIGTDVSIGPGSSICAGARVGNSSRIGAGVTIGTNAAIGESVRIHDNVTIYARCEIGDRSIVHSGTVIGSDGFGFAPTESGLRKIPQISHVEIGPDVEIGSNCSIDRGALAPTTIANGVKLDNMIQVGHNVQIGAHTVIAAQTGIAGSVVIGSGCMIGGQVGIAGHLEIGDGCRIAAKSGIMRDLPSGSTVGGVPAVSHRQWLRTVAALDKLPDFLREWKSKDTS